MFCMDIHRPHLAPTTTFFLATHLVPLKGTNMKIREGEFAYDIEPVKDPSTMLFKHFKVTIERVRLQGDQKVFEGTANTFDQAKALAERELQKLAPEKHQFRQAN